MLSGGIGTVLKRLHYPLDVILLCVRYVRSSAIRSGSTRAAPLTAGIGSNNAFNFFGDCFEPACAFLFAIEKACYWDGKKQG